MAEKSGRSVSSAGDVDGDGFDDLIVGAPYADASGSSSGASYVVFGKAGGFPADIELADLDGTNGFQISGEADGDASGRNVASAGDVNGDGFGDVIVGAPYADANGGDSGASYVVFGQAAGFPADIELSDLDGTSGFRIDGEAAGDASGRFVSSAGDVNGDGFDDLVIGAPYADANGNSSGATYVVFGQAGGFAADIELADLDGTNGFRISGEAAGDASGMSVTSAGDVNGDGFDDLIIGAPYADTGGSAAGATYVVFGQAGGFPGDIDLSDLDGTNGFEISGVSGGDASGRSVGSAGDVNGDGFDDLIVGAPFADANGSASGASYVVFGHAGSFAADVQLADLDGTNGFRISGEAAGDASGRFVSSAGDVNGDGFDDLVIGAPYADANGISSGASYVVFGQAEGFAAEIDLSDLDGSDGFRISGEAAFDFSGGAVTSAGDVNGDGFDDLIVGAPYADANGENSGASYVVFGHAGDFAADIALADLDGTNGFEISGEATDERIVGTRSADDLVGDAGDDTIRGRAGDDLLSGRDGDDRAFGGLGADSLSGGEGDDMLGVIFGRNTVEFADGDGVDMVVGYKPGIDDFDLTAVAAADEFDDLRLIPCHHGVLVDYGSGALLLTHTSVGSVEADDFLF
jgi:hypothetical protein